MAAFSDAAHRARKTKEKSCVGDAKVVGARNKTPASLKEAEGVVFLDKPGSARTCRPFQAMSS